MAFCKNCGQPVDENANNCPNCGTPVEKTAPQAQTAAAQSAPANDDVQKNKGLAWLAYFGILLLIPLFARKDSEYCKFHVKQGVTTLCVSIVLWIIRMIINAVLGGIVASMVYSYNRVGLTVVGIIAAILGFVFFAVSVFIIVCDIIGIVNAVKGEEKELPIFGKITVLHPLVDKIYASLNK